MPVLFQDLLHPKSEQQCAVTRLDATEISKMIPQPTIQQPEKRWINAGSCRPQSCLLLSEAFVARLTAADTAKSVYVPAAWKHPASNSRATKILAKASSKFISLQVLTG